MRTILVIVLVLLSTGQAHASAVTEEVPGGNSILDNPHFHIFAVKIESVRGTNTTNGDPPQGLVLIEEVLRGRDVSPGSYTFRLLPPLTHEDFLEDGETLKPQWKDRPLPGPSEGDRLIVFAYIWKEELEKRSTIVLQGPLYRYTAENRRRVLKSMAPLERSMGVQLPLLGIIAVLPVASVVVFAVSQPRRVPRSAAKKAKILSLALSGTAFIVYGYYESGISRYSDIRVDMLVVLPALFVGMIMVVLSGVSLLRMRGRYGE